MNTGITIALAARQSAPAAPITLPVFQQLSALLKTAGGDNSLHDFTATTDTGTLTSPDLSGNGNAFTQPLAARKPAPGPQGLTFAADDHLAQAINGGTYSVVATIMLGAGTTNGVVIANQAADTIAAYTQASTIAMSGSVNGVSVATRGAFFTALSITESRRCRLSGLVLTGANQLRIGRSSSVGMVGTVRRFVLLNHATLGSNLGAAIALAEDWVAA